METFYWTYPNGRILINNASWVLWLWAPCQVQTFLACGMKSQWNRTEKVTERERERERERDRVMAREGGKRERGNRAPSWKQARLWLICKVLGIQGGQGSPPSNWKPVCQELWKLLKVLREWDLCLRTAVFAVTYPSPCHSERIVTFCFEYQCVKSTVP